LNIKRKKKIDLMKLLRRFVSLFLLPAFLLSACGNDLPTPPPVEVTPASTRDVLLTPVDLQVGYGVRGPWFELYFTDPINPVSSQGTGGVDGPLVEAIDAARLSIDVAAYSLSLNSVRYALIRAHDRGVNVRVVMESTNMDKSDPQKMIEAGIPIIGDNMDGLMHDKFMVIDRSEVWMGSMNFTDSGAYDDNNNLFRIHSTKMAENYSKEFEEMFLDNKFGPNVVAETPFPDLTIDGTDVKTFYSPDDGVLNALAPLLSSAGQSVYFLAYSFTSNELGDIVRKKAEDGLDVKGVMDAEQVVSNQGTEYDLFKQADMSVRLDGNEGLMHHKVFVIDGKIVAFGSYNFSKSAEENNDENLIIIYSKPLAQQFIDEFYRVWNQASEE
jgi:phosphatidylserine/phosphatidylglycerophosphate/cardiolipin synthase-like enzyme